MEYFNSEDLNKFSEVGLFRKELMDKFFEYYNSVVGNDGALTKREKALIALAVAHTVQCPYCIEAYSKAALQQGSDLEERAEPDGLRREGCWPA